MKAKLIKVDTGWILMVDNKIYASHNDILSLKNCQAIELGYDLDELARDSSREYFIKPIESPIFTFGYEEGFQKALELMGDKKFSEEDMGKAWSEGYHRKVDELNGNGLRYFDKFIQSLQQKEWDVEIVTENVCGRCYSNNTNECWSTKECSDGKYDYPKPLLDADGCLILKRI